MQLKRPRLDRAKITSDIIAGTTVALVSIPDGMAQALIADVNPIYGLYTGMITTIVGSLTTRSSFMIVSLTNALALVTGSALGGLQGTVRIEALFTLTLMVGVIQLALGLLKLGGLVRFISDSVMTGFIAAAALLIILSQLKHVTGFAVSTKNLVGQAAEIFNNLGNISLQTISIGVTTITLLIILKRSPLKRFADILAIVASTAFLAIAGWESVEKVGDIAKISNSLPALNLPALSLAPELLTGAVALAILGLTQSAGISAAFPNPDGKRVDQSRNFGSQGAANIAGSFFQAMPAGGSLSATGLNVLGGARTRWAGVIAGVVLMALVLIAGSAAQIIPLAGLAGLLIVAGATILADRWPHILRTWQVSKVSALAMVVTFVVAISVSLQTAIYTGVLLSLLLHIYSSAASVQLRAIAPVKDGDYEERAVPEKLPPSQLTILQIRGNFYFASVYALEEMLPSTDQAHKSVVILRLRGRGSISTTFLNWLRRYHRELESTNSRLILVGLEETPMNQLEKTGFIDELGEANIFPAQPTLQKSLREAVAAADQWLEGSKGDGPTQR